MRVPSIADQLWSISEVDLQDMSATLSAEIADITSQLEGWRDGLNGEGYMATDEWAIRARMALRFKKRHRAEVRGEITRRRLEKEPNNTHEKKLERIALSNESNKDANKAFVRAAYRLFGEEECKDIWKSAREWFPECFASDEEAA